MITSLVKRLIGADRPRVLAVIGVTREEVEAGVRHARTAGSELPVRTWCAEEGATARQVRRDLRQVWPALTIVGWTGKPGHTALKLAACTVPPFRIVIFNEAEGFFAARPGAVAAHAGRRLRDALLAHWNRTTGWIYSVGYRAGQRIRDVGWLIYSLALEVLVLAARLTPSMAHRAISGIKPTGQVLAVPIPRIEGKTCTEVTLSGRAWPRSQVRKAVERNADFIVFRTQTDHGDPMPLMELAIESGAFAAARQIAWTGWRRQIVNKHPFRRLQPGEAAAVFAPWSSLMVVRRDLLAKLGVPHAATSGAALMILFWRAAAAGWTSLVQGNAEAMTQEPAMPLEDTEFAARVALSARLKSLALPQARRPRGNVAWSPANVQPLRGLPRILIVSPYLPFPLSHGGAVRIYNLCRALAGRVDFILACFHEAKETVRYAELHEVFREVYTVDIDEKNADPTVPKQVAEYRNSAMADLIGRLCEERAVDLVQLEYTQMAEYRSCAGKVPAILVEHDITFTLYRQLADPSAPLWFEFEGKALRDAAGVWTMSEHDRVLALEQGAPPRTTVAVPNGVDLARFHPERRESAARTILFVGSFRHLPNLLAFEALRQTIMPAVWQEFPDCRLHVIAGPDHERAAQLARKLPLLAKDVRIVIEGFVEDVRPAYRECDVVAIPLPVSAGTNIKLMEAMASGRAIVSSPVGCQGMELVDGLQLLIRDIGPDFAEGLLVLLRDEEMREEIVRRARQTAEDRFGWDAIAETAYRAAAEVCATVSGAHPLFRGAFESEYRE